MINDSCGNGRGCSVSYQLPTCIIVGDISTRMLQTEHGIQALFLSPYATLDKRSQARIKAKITQNINAFGVMCVLPKHMDIFDSWLN